MSSYESVTELPGYKAHKEQIKSIRTRYKWAGENCAGKDTLEIACGSGIGLGILNKYTRSLIAGDIDENILEFPIQHYKESNIEVYKIDASEMNFVNGTFDSVICFEAIYYFPSLKKVLSEVNRILRDDGEFLGCTVNCEWHGFIPSKFSTKYYSMNDLKQIFTQSGFKTEFFLAYEDKQSGFGKMTSIIRSVASYLNMIPSSMKGKEFLKRIFYGQLSELPNELEETGCVEDLIEYNYHINLKDYKVIFFRARK